MLRKLGEVEEGVFHNFKVCTSVRKDSNKKQQQGIDLLLLQFWKNQNNEEL